MKKVFSSHADCIHVFCQFTQNEGRSGNVFFENDTLYSYGRHFELAKLVDGVLWVNTRNYSNSTSKHQSILRSAINRNVTKEVVFADFSGGRFHPRQNMEGHIKNANYHFQIWAKNKRGFKELQNACEYISKFETFRKHFPNLELWEAFSFDTSKAFEELHKRKAEQRLKNEARQEKEREKHASLLEIARLEQAEKLESWLKGEYPGMLANLDKTYLRIKGRIVETTKGAKVPLSEALELLKDIRAGVDCVGRKIGHFTVNAVTLDNVVIGCHTLKWDVINDIFPN